jgi:Tol biopolymer transport system component
VDMDVPIMYPNVQCPAWSPDGQRLAFLGMEESYARTVAILTFDTSRVDLIGSGACPAWSPDGKLIAFTKIPPRGEKGGTIFTSNLDGSTVTKLFETTKEYGFGNLTWSSDGAYIVYSVMTTPNKANVPNDWTLALIPIGANLNDSNTKPVYIAKGMNPAWMPQRPASQQ